VTVFRPMNNSNGTLCVPNLNFHGQYFEIYNGTKSHYKSSMV